MPPRRRPERRRKDPHVPTEVQIRVVTNDLPTRPMPPVWSMPPKYAPDIKPVVLEAPMNNEPTPPIAVFVVLLIMAFLLVVAFPLGVVVALIGLLFLTKRVESW